MQKFLRFILSLLLLITTSSLIIVFVIKASLDENLLASIIDYATTTYEMPEELANYKETKEYQELESQISEINNLVNRPEVKYTVKVLRLINDEHTLVVLSISTLVIIILFILIAKNVFIVLLNLSFDIMLTSIFVAIVPTIFSNYQTNSIVLTNMFKTMSTYSYILCGVSVVAFLLSLIFREKLKLILEEKDKI